MYITFTQFLNENSKRFIINENKFQLFLNDILVAVSEFNIKQPDEWFDEKYIILHDLETFEDFRGKGLAKYMLNKIFEYVKNLGINLIALIVYKDNPKAVKLYFNSGFEIFKEYDDSYSLIKKL
jgi:ribosomal protein S18 acetylase RimI-like enzyme